MMNFHRDNQKILRGTFILNYPIEKYLDFPRFIINQLFNGSNPDNRSLSRHLTVYPESTSKIVFILLISFLTLNV